MTRLCYATDVQLAELIRPSGLPDNAPPANAFRNLARADELDVEMLVARMETEALACHSQLIGPLQFGAWTRKPCGAPC
jgi:hypothetical protein